MSRRTQSLPPLTGIAHVWREIRYHEAARQSLSVAAVITFTFFGEPTKLLFTLGSLLVLFGLAMRMWASGYIAKNQVLATSGPYALVRHPLYTGNISLLFGFAFASGLWWGGLVALIILATFYPPTVAYEDGKMREKFPDAWNEWAPVVPALVPRLSFWRSEEQIPWSFRRCLRRNGEPASALFLLALLLVLGSRLAA